MVQELESDSWNHHPVCGQLDASHLLLSAAATPPGQEGRFAPNTVVYTSEPETSMDTSDLTCPRCRTVLRPQSASFGTLWQCPDCNGRAVGLAVLRTLFTPESINPLWLQTIDGKGQPGGACPSCRNTMIEVALSDAPRVGIDVCRLCQFIWFDVHEMEGLAPQSDAEKARALSERARATQKAMARTAEFVKENDARIAAERWRLITMAMFYP